MPDVRMPDGTIIRNVPEGTTREQLQAKINAHKPESFWQGVVNSVRDAAPKYQWVLDTLTGQNIAKTLTGVPTTADLQRAQAEQAKARAKYQGSTAGNVVGGIAATIPTMLLPGGPLVQGAAQGAVLSNARDAKGLARDVAVSAALGKAGDIAARGLGAAIGGSRISKAAKTLVNEGVTLTPGQLGGPNSVRQLVEDKVLGSIPGLSNIPDAAALRANNGLRIAAANRVLKPLGDSVPKGTQFDANFLGQLQDKVYNNYANAAGDLRLGLDPELAMNLAYIVQAAPRLVGEDGTKQIAANVSHIAQMTNQQPITGQVLRDTLGGIRKAASGAQGELRSQLWNVHDEVANALERQNSGALTDNFVNARDAVSLLKRVENAASRPGVTDAAFGPTQLSQAVRKRGFGTTDANIANGTAPMQDLADSAAEVMRNKTANSGTVPRLMAVKALAGEGGIGSLVGGAALLHHPVAAAAIGGSMLGYLPGLAEILQSAAVNRPQVAQQAGRLIEGTAPYAGLLGANLGMNYFGN